MSQVISHAAPYAVIPLREYIAQRSRQLVSAELGCTPAALSKAMKRGRVIYVSVDASGGLSAFEISSFPNGNFIHVEHPRGTVDCCADTSGILQTSAENPLPARPP